MKFRMFAAVAAAILTASVANATDLPNKKAPPAGPTIVQPWTGAYIGGSLGVARTTEDGSLTGDAENRVIPGIYGGYNYQMNSNVVLGVEGDLGYMDLTQDDSGSNPGSLTDACYKVNKNGKVVVKGSSAANCNGSGFQFGPLPGGTQSTSSSSSFSIRDLDTLRLRAGYLVQPNTLAFVTGGFGFAHASLDSTVDAVTESTSGYHTGWVLGGGVEHSYGKWTAKVDYLYYDLGSIETSTDTVDLKGNLIRAGVAYRF